MSIQPASLPLRALRRLHTHPRRSLRIVFLIVVIAGFFGGGVASVLQTEGGFVPSNAESVQAVERIEAATGEAPSAGIVLLVDVKGDAEAGTAAQAERTLASIDDIASVKAGGFSKDKSSAIVVGSLKAGALEKPVAEDVVDAFADNPDVTVGGQAVAQLQIADQVKLDLRNAELLAFPILVVLAMLIFGIRASVLPLVVSVATVFGTFLALTGINGVYNLSGFALNLVIGLGLGLAVDYTLFLLSRYREELEKQGPTFGAVVTTMRTAGHTVLFSAVTVAAALITLTIFPMQFLRSMGIAGAVVAVAAAASALVITPAIFGLWGAKLARKSKPSKEDAPSSRWYVLSHAVMRRPGLIAVGTAAIMIALAAPAVQAVWTPIDSSVVPTSLSARTVTDTIKTDYANAGTSLVSVAVTSNDPGAVKAFATDASAINGVVDTAPAINLSGETWQINLPVRGEAAGDDAQQVVDEVRTLALDTDVDALVAGPAAEFVDQQNGIADALPLAIGLLVLLTLVILWLMTGSVILPIQTVLMNTLTVGVSLGLISFIYQGGRLSGLLDYTPNGGVEPTGFLVAAALVFALSTDYGVFLLGRIKEARDLGLSEREAIATGLSRTGGVVTSAAILLAVAIGAFSTGSISFMQQIGLATAAGVLIDAFVVRSLLVPSLMGLSGKWNWWAPMWMRALHDRIGFSEPVESTTS